MARLTTESALWPKPRVSVTQTSSAIVPATWLITSVTRPSSSATTVRTMRLPRRSMSLPTPAQNSAPAIVAAKLI